MEELKGECNTELPSIINSLTISADTGDTELFYKKAEDYWSTVDPTVNGVLGGFGWISTIDVRGSDKFLTTLLKSKEPPGHARALDCGAGVGRVTRELLVRHFTKVDLVEQNATFLDEAKKSLKDENRAGEFYTCSLRDFEPESKYDVIWCQWVLSHLTDLDLTAFLQRCGAALQPRGVIVVKENIASEVDVRDDEDSSVTRPAKRFLQIFQNASLRVIRQATQTNFPDGLFSVKVFALRPLAPPATRSSAKSAAAPPSVHVGAEGQTTEVFS